MASFFLAEIEITDRAMYDEYVANAVPIVRAHGGEYVVRSERVTPVAGDWQPERILMIRFPTRAAIAACFGSPGYQAVKHLREGSTRSRAVIVDD